METFSCWKCGCRKEETKKNKKRKKKGKKRRVRDDDEEKKAFDPNENRFASVYDDPDFAIDRTHKRFKATPATEAIMDRRLDTKEKRTAEQRRKDKKRARKKKRREKKKKKEGMKNLSKRIFISPLQLTTTRITLIKTLKVAIRI